MAEDLVACRPSGNPLSAVDRAEWHFLASNCPGTVGADPRVLDLLRQPGIPYPIYPPS